ncbi:MAG TPA: hypothetical protein VE077_01335, partial [Candidatus Methylomirabilis sp.]|nr:hypothetical protein [Candidatus Methylomirabilis sp.]
MSQQAQHQPVPQQSTTPHPNPPQPIKDKPDAFARLAEAVDGALKRLNHPKAEKRHAPRKPVSLASLASGSPSASSPPPSAGKAAVHDPARSADEFGSRAVSHVPQKVPSTLLPQAAVLHSASSALSVHGSRATTHGSRAAHSSGGKPPSRPATVSQAKNYLRATRPPKFLNPHRSLERHARKCAICHHPEREMIEELFVRWHSPECIANHLEDWDNVNWVSIYRHAYALGLDAVRRRNLGFVFENILDNAAEAIPTAAGVVAAARALTCVNSEGRWVEPEKRITMTTIIRHDEPSGTTYTEPEDSSGSTQQDVAVLSSTLAPARRSGEEASNKPATAASRRARHQQDVAPFASSRERSEGRGPASTTLRASRQDRDIAEES